MKWLQLFFWIVWIIGLLIVIAYGLVILFGAPYLPTLRTERQKVFDLLNLQPGQLFVDLGCGDGVMLVMAAEQGLKAIGYEINPFLWFYAWLRTRRYGRKVSVKYKSFWQADLSNADGIFVFLITHHMKRLDKLLSKCASKNKLKVVSNAFKIPDRPIKKSTGSMFLYLY